MISISKNKKLYIFSALVICFSFISVFFRNIIINNFDNKDLFILTIDHLKNYGAAFSLLHTHTSFLVVISAIILLMVIVYIIKNIDSFSKQDVFFSSLLCSGIICNLFERIIDGFVTDYIRLNFVSFPIFNISDMFICIGAFALICNILFNNDND